MLHPVGSLPPSVYWRRRAALLASLVVLIGLTVWVLRSSDNGNASGAGGPTTTPRTTAQTQTTQQQSTTTAAGSSSTAGSSSSSASASNTGGVLRCTAVQLTVSALTNQPSYHVGDQPTLSLQVTNKGPRPCVQDLADSQIELRIYNGESRVWGSHDCQVQPGAMDRTLAVNQPVKVSIVWSGLSSQPQCAGTRQRVGAGTYTLYALLSAHNGQAAQFAIS